MVVCLERGADCLHMVQLGCRGKEAIEPVARSYYEIFVCVCVIFFVYFGNFIYWAS